ncbi:DUF5808 domain-containing protein [Paenibacillus sacheonensis]|uniref:DUF1648 domain-containing protein n=1 Tax=Paenibacillus sacheonensis TaxID=742054 RepID=A0A7X5C1Y9_9BACL|nr:DUF5808 domain-containing protein [Paenibacillus sacheonensis]MBM7568009.1 putative membrane protein [Paenibacillus sacheonensis]NBC73216.1 DUF1648 domain-containing protein [Paenibacillus sacheonensis]
MNKGSNNHEGVLSMHWYWVQGLLIAGSALAAAWLWKDIPPTLTTHYNIRFEADGYSGKSWGTVFLFNFVQLCLLATILGTNAVIAQAKPGGSSDSGTSENKQRRFRYVNSVFLYGLSLLLTAFFSYIQATMLYGWPTKALSIVTIAVMALIVLGVIGLIVTVRRLGLREGSAQDEEHWLAGGGVYYNPSDPAIFVPKKLGIGWTVNFGRPMGWVVIATLILIPFAIVMLVALMVE